MPRKQIAVPWYSLNKPTGQAYVRLPNGAGTNQFLYLGKHGTPSRFLSSAKVIPNARNMPAKTGIAEQRVIGSTSRFAGWNHPDGHLVP